MPDRAAAHNSAPTEQAAPPEEGGESPGATVPGGVVPPLSGPEIKQVEERQLPGAPVLHETIRRAGEVELSRPVAALAWSALAAGLSMGFSMATEGLLRTLLPHAAWSPLIAKLGYSAGFLIVILGRQQLFTENTLTPVLSLLSKRDLPTLLKVARLWGVVLACNLIGAVLFALIASRSDLFAADVRHTFVEMGREAATGPFGTILLRGIFGGWLIALMVWLIPGAGGSRLPVILLITYLVGLGRFSHSIAGTVDVASAAFNGAVSWGDFFAAFLIPTVLGNIIGGVSLVAALNHAQVVAGHDVPGRRLTYPTARAVTATRSRPERLAS